MQNGWGIRDICCMKVHKSSKANMEAWGVPTSLFLRHFLIIGLLLPFVSTGQTSPNFNLTFLCKTLEPCITSGASRVDGDVVSLEYIYINPPVIRGEEFTVIDSGVSMHSGDHFRINVTAHKATYLYLLYVDGSGHFKELLQLSNQHANYLEVNQKVVLPSSEQSFNIDDQDVGEELIYPIVSSVPRPDIIALYQQANTEIKGSTATPNRNKIITSQCGDPCVAPFTILHLSRFE